jgi:hypothetical protein
MKIVAYSSRPDFFVNQQGRKCSLKQAVANKKAVDNYGCGRNGWLGRLFQDSGGEDGAVAPEGGDVYRDTTFAITSPKLLRRKSIPLEGEFQCDERIMISLPHVLQVGSDKFATRVDAVIAARSYLSHRPG